MFVNKKFVNEGLITKITKILCLENLELYGIMGVHLLSGCTQFASNMQQLVMNKYSYNPFYITQACK